MAQPLLLALHISEDDIDFALWRFPKDEPADALHKFVNQLWDDRRFFFNDAGERCIWGKGSSSLAPI